jgi:hypothetical protein
MAVRTLLGSTLTRSGATTAIALVAILALGHVGRAQAPQVTAGSTSIPTVTAAALEPFLPVPADWTRTVRGGDRVVLSDTCSYVFVDAIYTRGDAKIRLTLADTGGHEDGLNLVAMLVTSFPDDYSGDVPPATTIRRVTLNGLPAGFRWDGKALDGEFAVVVGKRFVARAEGWKIASADELRDLVTLIDFKKLGDLR